jgi:hypothetical protein
MLHTLPFALTIVSARYLRVTSISQFDLFGSIISAGESK